MSEPGEPAASLPEGVPDVPQAADGSALGAVSKPPSSARDFLSRLGLAKQDAPISVGPDGPVERPTFFFFGVVAGVSLLADVTTKAWAEIALSKRLFTMEPGIVLIEKHLTLTLAYNKGGAWGLLSDASETIRRPFFFAVSV